MRTNDRHEELAEGAEPPPPGVGVASAVRWVVLGAVCLVAAVSVAWGVGLLDGRGGGRDEGHAAERRDLWTCPMHPQIVRDRPGTCPICNMSLVRRQVTVPDAAAEPSPAVPGLAPLTLDPDRLRLAGVRTVAATHQTLSDPVRAVATVAADETRVVRVQTRFSGWIEELKADQTGQRVRKGDVLAGIFSRELFTAQEELLQAAEWARTGGDEAARKLHMQARRRLELLGVASEEIDAIEARGAAIRALPIRSPISGFITGKSVLRGTYVDPGTELFEIADLSRVWTWADVYERDLASVAVGQTARLTVRALPGKVFEGRVAFVEPAVDPRTRTLRARVELPNPGFVLKPGLYGELVIETPPRHGVAVPREALVDTGERQYVFVAVLSGQDGTTFEPRPVVAGAGNDDRVLVLTGVEAGELVVTRGNFLLDSESRLRATSRAGSALHRGHTSGDGGQSPPPTGGADHSTHGGTP